MSNWDYFAAYEMAGSYVDYGKILAPSCSYYALSDGSTLKIEICFATTISFHVVGKRAVSSFEKELLDRCFLF